MPLDNRLRGRGGEPSEQGIGRYAEAGGGVTGGDGDGFRQGHDAQPRDVGELRRVVGVAEADVGVVMRDKEGGGRDAGRDGDAGGASADQLPRACFQFAARAGVKRVNAVKHLPGVVAAGVGLRGGGGEAQAVVQQELQRVALAGARIVAAGEDEAVAGDGGAATQRQAAGEFFNVCGIGAEVEVAGFAVFDGFAQQAGRGATAADGVARPGGGEVGKGGAEAARAEKVQGHGSIRVS